MTYTIRRYASYQEYLDAEELSPEGNYRLLSTGEVIEVPIENDINAEIIAVLFTVLVMAQGPSFGKLLRPGSKEIQVQPVGDRCVNRKPDLMVIKDLHRRIFKQAILLGAPPPQFVAEVVSPGSESSENYLRDYVWKRKQYEWWQIPEYWIIDPHREKVTALILVEGTYQESAFTGEAVIRSQVFPELKLTVKALISGQIDD